MNNPSNSEFFSSKPPLRLRIIPPKSSRHDDEVSPACHKAEAVIGDDKYSMPLIKEAINKDHSPMSEETEAEVEVIKRSERQKPTCDVCHKSFDSVKAVQGHMRIHPKIPGQKKRGIDECKMSRSKKVKLSNLRGEVENRERKRRNHQEDNAVRDSDNTMFLDSRMRKGESTRNHNDPGGEQEKINGALNLLYLKYGMDWEEYTHQNSCTSTKRWTSEGDGSGSSNNAELVMGSDIRFTICVSTGPTTHNIPESSVQINPVEAESLKEKESSVNSSTQIPTEYKISNVKEKGKEKEMMIVSSSVKRNYVCEICDMSFSSHQALGGHKTKHNRKPGGGHKKKNVEREHVCEICGEVFPTGQQLGGHKSKHRSKPISESSSLVIIKEQGKGSTPVIDKEKGEVAKGDVNDGGTEQVPVECRAPAARVGRDFDLNVAAVPMEEDGDHALLSLKLWVHN